MYFKEQGILLSSFMACTHRYCFSVFDMRLKYTSNSGQYNTLHFSGAMWVQFVLKTKQTKPILLLQFTFTQAWLPQGNVAIYKNLQQEQYTIHSVRFTMLSSSEEDT